MVEQRYMCLVTTKERLPYILFHLFYVVMCKLFTFPIPINFPIFQFPEANFKELNRIDLAFQSALCMRIYFLFTRTVFPSCRYVTRSCNEVAFSCTDDVHTLFSVIRRICRTIRDCDRINSSIQNTFDRLDFTTVWIKALIYFARDIRAIEFGK